MSRVRIIRAAIAGVAAAACAHAGAQTVTYTFSELPVGTAVTTQYYGVTFSVVGQSCGNSPTLYMRTASSFFGNSFSDPVLVIDQGCPDFSSDYLRMVFTEPTTEVSFTLGPWNGNYQVRAYNSSGGLVSTQSISIGGSGFVDVNRLVTFKAATPLFKRIEVQETVGLFEAIDDLTFMLDDTPPVVSITSPTTMQCYCGGTIFGSAHDPDGPFGSWRLEYSTAPAGPWSTIATSTSERINAALASWNTSTRPEGYHYIRLTAENAVGLSASTTVAVWVSRDFDVVDLYLPSVVGAGAHPNGTAQDNFCSEEYQVQFRPLGGEFEPVDPSHPVYAGSRVNQTFAVWNTRAVPDGTYEVRVTGTNSCGQAAAEQQSVVVDNTAPTAEISEPGSCQFMPPGVHPIVGTVADANLAAWSLQFVGGPHHQWVTLASGSTARVNQVLAQWDTRNLPPCDYTLRLIATDQAVLDGNGAIHNQTEHTVSVRVGCPADFNLNWNVDVFDLLDYLTYWFQDCP